MMSNQKILCERLNTLIAYKLPKHGALAQLSRETEIPASTWSAARAGRIPPNAEILMAICAKFPQYTLWLMTGQTNEGAGQSSPEIDQLRELEERVRGKSDKRA